MVPSKVCFSTNWLELPESQRTVCTTLTTASPEKWRMAFFDFGWLKNLFKNFSNNVSDGYAFNLALGMFISAICAADFLI